MSHLLHYKKNREKCLTSSASHCSESFIYNSPFYDPAFLPLYLFHRSSSASLRAAYNEFFLCQFSTVYYTLRFILLLHYSLKTASWTLYLNTSENLLGIRILLKVKFYSLNFSVDYFMKVSKVSKGSERFWKVLKCSERFR